MAFKDCRKSRHRQNKLAITPRRRMCLAPVQHNRALARLGRRSAAQLPNRGIHSPRTVWVLTAGGGRAMEPSFPGHGGVVLISRKPIQQAQKESGAAVDEAEGSRR